MKITAAGRNVELGNADKVLFPADGYAKQDVARYYLSVAERILPHLEDRYITLHRFPDGISKDGFYQQNRPDYFPDYVRGEAAKKAGGDDTVTHMMVQDAAGLVYLADQGTIAIHGWQSRSGTLRCPDRLVFDLDPSSDDFGALRRCARALRAALEKTGLRPYVMTTGSSGLHVVAALDGSLDFDAARQYAGRVAASVADDHPEDFTTEQRKNKRRGRLYIDISRNAYGQTGIVPYSLRALPSAPAATPLDWDELGGRGLHPRRYGLGNVARRLGQKADPWRDFFSHATAPDAAAMRRDDDSD